MWSNRRFALLPASVLAIAGAAAAQPPDMPPSPVGFSTARSHAVRGTLALTGTVESRRTSLVATEVAGVVEQLAARDGDRVRRGGALVRLRATDVRLRLEAARGQLQEAEARLKLANAQLERSRDLFEQQIVSRDTLDDAMAESEAWSGRVSQLRSDVARLEEDLKRTTVRAPFSGVVVREHVAEGEWVAVGDPVAEMVDLSDLEVTVEAPESYFAGLEVGSGARVVFDALGGREADGRVRAVVPKASPQARTFPVKVGIGADGGRVGVGMLARVVLPVGEPRPGVIVPKDAVAGQGAEAAVFVIGDEDRVRRVAVRTGVGVGAWVAVEGELAAGDRVVTRGNERLFPGQQVAPQPVEYELP